MRRKRWKVGIVGVEPGRSWAAQAHIPALRALPESFEIVGIANTSLASSQRAATQLGILQAFASVNELVTSSEIDIVSVTVRVPHHLEIVKAAIAAGKHVYCEWPLGNGRDEAEHLAALAREKGILGVIGTQATAAPQIEYLKQLIADEFVGEVLSTTVTAWGGAWGEFIPQRKGYDYLLDKTNGATMLTIPVGHMMAAVREVLGDVAELSSVLATRRISALVADTGETLPMSAPDQVLMSGILASGAPVAIHYRGGMPRDADGLLWEINGTEGDIRVTGASGHSQLVPLFLKGAQGNEKAFQTLEPPQSYRVDFPDDVAPGNVARNYAKMARDLCEGTHTAPTFDDAVAIHRIIAAIERSSEDGKRTRVVPG